MGKSQAQINAEMQASNDQLRAMQIAETNARIAATFSQSVSSHLQHWLENEYHLWQNAVANTRSALYLADKYYNEVLSAKPIPSIFEAVLGGIIKGFALVNPEFAMLAAVLQLGVTGTKEQRKKRQETVDGFKEIFSEAYEKGREAFEKREEAESHDSQLEAETDFVNDEMDECSKTAEWITDMLFAFQTRLDQSPVGSGTEYTRMQQDWCLLVGGPATHYKKGTNEQLALIFLYDMLRKYCAQSVRLVVPGLHGYQPLPPNVRRELVGLELIKSLGRGKGDPDAWVKSIQFTGLEPEKRTAMYKKFSHIERLDSSRPKIEDYIDLADGWEFAS
jgi:hypothetical protein